MNVYDIALTMIGWLILGGAIGVVVFLVRTRPRRQKHRARIAELTRARSRAAGSLIRYAGHLATAIKAPAGDGGIVGARVLYDDDHAELVRLLSAHERATRDLMAELDSRRHLRWWQQ